MADNLLASLGSSLAKALSAKSGKKAVTAVSLAAAEVNGRLDAIEAILATVAKKAGVTIDDLNLPPMDRERVAEIEFMRQDSTHAHAIRILGGPSF